jgi:hypothetical protein
MFDYGYVVMARLDYEERVRKVEMMLQAQRQQQGRQPGLVSRMLYSVGEWLETAGSRLKAQHQPIPIRQTYSNGRTA